MRSTFFLTASLVFGLTAAAQKPVEHKTETRMIIRGGSFNGEKPLVLVDGKVVEDINSVTPDRIASIDVLKGNSATTLYGTEGKNGVIVITTKSVGQADTVTPGTRKVERRVMVNTFRTSDGSKDTTIIRTDSVTMKVEVDGERIVIDGMPLDIKEQRIVEGFRLPDMPEGELREFELAMPRIMMDGAENRKVFLFKNDGSSPFEKSAPKIGLSVQDTEEGKGVQVLSVLPTSAAAKAGIQANDRIVSIDQTVVNDVDGLKRAIENTSSKRSVMVHVQREKKEMHIELLYPRELKKADL
jgi:TonB-dependent SusC/RagA subfamily outer membrane receptor